MNKVKEKLDDISFGSYAEETFLIQEVELLAGMGKHVYSLQGLVGKMQRVI